MALLYHLGLACLAMLMLDLHVEFASAAVQVMSLRGSNLSGDPGGNPPDPYVKVWCGSTFGGMTEYKKDNAGPVWDAEFTFRDGRVGDTLKLEVWDKDLNYDDHLFTCTKVVTKSSEDASCSSPKGILHYKYRVY